MLVKYWYLKFSPGVTQYFTVDAVFKHAGAEISSGHQYLQPSEPNGREGNRVEVNQEAECIDVFMSNHATDWHSLVVGGTYLGREGEMTYTLNFNFLKGGTTHIGLPPTDTVTVPTPAPPPTPIPMPVPSPGPSPTPAQTPKSSKLWLILVALALLVIASKNVKKH